MCPSTIFCTCVLSYYGTHKTKVLTYRLREEIIPNTLNLFNECKSFFQQYFCVRNLVEIGAQQLIQVETAGGKL